MNTTNISTLKFDPCSNRCFVRVPSESLLRFNKTPASPAPEDSVNSITNFSLNYFTDDQLNFSRDPIPPANRLETDIVVGTVNQKVTIQSRKFGIIIVGFEGNAKITGFDDPIDVIQLENYNLTNNFLPVLETGIGLETIQGRPAIAFPNNQRLDFLRSSDPTGLQWDNKPITLDSGNFDVRALVKTQDDIAWVVYIDRSINKIKIVSSREPLATNWNNPFEIDDGDQADATTVGNTVYIAYTKFAALNIAIVNSSSVRILPELDFNMANPSVNNVNERVFVSYYDTGFQKLKVARQTSAGGTNFDITTLDDGGELNSMASIAAFPGIAYTDPDKNIRFITSNDMGASSSITWLPPRIAYHASPTANITISTVKLEPVVRQVLNRNIVLPGILFGLSNQGPFGLFGIAGADIRGTSWLPVRQLASISLGPPIGANLLLLKNSSVPAIIYLDSSDGYYKYLYPGLNITVKGISF